MASFGQYLVERKLVSREQLDEATQALVLFGGRVGTNLVEAGHLTLEELEQYLAQFLGVPNPPREWVERPRRAALAAVSAELAERHFIVPLNLEKRTLHAALGDPTDPRRLAEVAYATGLGIEPYVLSEARLLFLLERHYGVRRDVRYALLCPGEAAGEGGRHTASASVPAPPPDDEEAARNRVALGLRPLAADEELIDPETFSTLHQGWIDERFGAAPAEDGEARAADAESPVPAPPTDAAAIATLEAELVGASDRETVTRIALALARVYARTAALFLVRDGMVHGCGASGGGLEESVRGIVMSRTVPSVLAPPTVSTEGYRGAPPRSGVDGQLFRALGRAEVRDVAVLPIAIRGRIVNLLYVDNEDEPIAETALAALRALCELVASVYEGIIVARKRTHC